MPGSPSLWCYTGGWSLIVGSTARNIELPPVSGIVFKDGPTGERAVIAGSGLDVWEVVATWKESGRDFAELCQSYDWLSEAQLRAALRYYELYPEEIDIRLEKERQWTPETIRLELK